MQILHVISPQLYFRDAYLVAIYVFQMSGFIIMNAIRLHKINNIIFLHNKNQFPIFVKKSYITKQIVLNTLFSIFHL